MKKFKIKNLSYFGNFIKVLVFLSFTFVVLVAFLATMDKSVKLAGAKVPQKDFIMSADSANPGFNAALVIDKNFESFWETGKPFPHWLRIDFKKKPKKITEYSLQTGPHGIDAAKRMPKDWQFQGSNNGLMWINLDSRKNEINWNINEKRTYKFSNSTAYRHYRLYMISGIEPTILRLYGFEMN